MGYVFQREWIEFFRRAGGVVGVFAAVFACLGVSLAAMRLRYDLLDPLILLALTALGFFFSAHWAAGAFASDREKSRLVNAGDAATDKEQILGKTLAAATFGLLVWGSAMAAGIVVLQGQDPRLAVPWEKLVPLGVFTFAASWGNACIAALLSITTDSEAMARRLVRGPGLFIVLLLVMAPRILPGELRGSAFRALTGNRLQVTMLLLSAVFVAIGWWMMRKTVAALEEKRHPLSILGDAN